MKKFVRILVATVLLLCVLMAGASAQVNLIAAHVTSEVGSFHHGMMAFKEKVEELSGGDITVEVHPNGELGGNESELVEKIATGTVDVTVAAPNYLAAIVPQADLFSILYLYEDLDHWKRVMQSDVAKTVMNTVEAGTGFHMLGMWSCGIREYYGTKPIATVEDLQNVKIRVMNSPTVQATWKALGAQPAVLAFNELYQGLQNNVIQSAENDLVNIRDMRFYEVAPYISMTNHDIATRFFLMSGDKYNLMNEAQKAWIAEAAAYACEAQWKYDEEVVDQARKDLESLGAVFNEVDAAAFQAAVSDVCAQAAADLGVSDLYEAIAALKDN